MRRFLPLFVLLLVLTRPGTGSAADLPAGTGRIGEGTVAEVLDGETVRLEDGRTVRLAGIQAPGAVPSLAAQAMAQLTALIRSRRVVLHRAGRDRSDDRHGRTLAHLVRDDGLWVQDALLRAGMARHLPQADLRALAAPMAAAERAARESGRGLWADPTYRVRDASLMTGWEPDIGGYHLVAGAVVAAERRKQRLYLNFGTDWRRDLTVEIVTRDLRLFTAVGLDPMALKGRRVEVRGWMESYNGPLIRVTHPDQIRLLGDERPSAP